MDPEQIRENLKLHLKQSRFLHSIGVQEVSHDLALIYGCDTKKAITAGILHDCAKNLTDEELLQACKKYHLPITAIEEKCVFLLHAKVGAALAKDRYDISDEEILNAITYHTTGRPGMTLLEKIVFTADYIEPYRRPLPRINEIREVAYRDLDLAVYMILENILNYLNGSDIDALTVETYDYYKKLLQTRQMERKEIIMDNTKQMVKLVYQALDEKKGEDIQIIEIKDISIIADFFIIANGTNASQVDALVNSVMDTLGRNGIEPKRVEGVRSASWILLDYGDVIVHVFSKEDRLFYNLERIWRDGKTISIDQLEE